MISAFKSFWKNAFNFRGRATRSEYWFFMLDNIIIAFILGFIMGIGTVIDGGEGGFVTFVCNIPYVLYLIAIIIPSLSLTIRRLHDVGKSGWWYLGCTLLNVFCGIGSIILFVFTVLDSKPDNQWGPNPKNMIYNPYNQQSYNQQPYNQNTYNNYNDPYNGQNRPY